MNYEYLTKKYITQNRKVNSSKISLYFIFNVIRDNFLIWDKKWNKRLPKNGRSYKTKTLNLSFLLKDYRSYSIYVYMFSIPAHQYTIQNIS